MRYSLLALVLTLIQAPAFAEVYKQVDEYGNVTYSDKPNSDNAKRVELPKTNTQPAINFKTPPPKKEQPSQPDYQLEITAPSTQSTIPTGQRQVTVSAQVFPPPSEGMILRLLLDGSPYGGPSSQGLWIIEEIHRGEHQLQVALQDQQGRIIALSDPITIFVQRHSGG